MASPAEPAAWKSHAASAPLYVAILLLAFLSVSSAFSWVGAARYPYALENGEGWVLANAVDLAEGQSPYGTLEDYPLLVGNYPPLYLLANAWAIRIWGFSPLYGRVISLSAWAVGVALVLLAARGMGAPWLVAGLGGLYALALPGMRFAAPQARVDMLAAALAFSGVVVFLRGGEKLSGVVLPAALFSAALATKHSMVAAPAAAFVWLLWHDRRRGVKLALWTLGLTLGWLTACWVVFGTEFFLNIGPYTSTIPWAWKNLARMGRLALGVWYLPALVSTVAYAAWALPRGGERERLVALYGLAAAGSILLVAKEGSSLLYLVEYTLAGSLTLACGVGLVLEAEGLKGAGRRFGVSLLVAVCLFYLQLPFQGHPLARRLGEARGFWSYSWEARKQRDELMISIIRKVDGPVLAEEPMYLLVAGKPVLLNPFVMKWMAAKGRWDEGRLVRDIARHRFSLIQLNGFAAPPSGRTMVGAERKLYVLTRARFSREVLRAIDLWYEVIRPLRNYPLGKAYVPK
jgi:hypothetical protein